MYKINQVEQVLWNLKPLTEQIYPLKEFIFDIEIFLRFWQNYEHLQDYQQIKNKLSQCISGYDFLILKILTTKIWIFILGGAILWNY
jgi:hypothetical protein